MKSGGIELTELALLVFLKGANEARLRAPASITNSYTLTLPADLPGSTQALVVSSTGQLSYQAVGGGGSVSSVALSLPNIFTVSGSPVTTTGTLSATLNNQTANLFFASPNGSTGAPTFRSLVWGDVSSLVGTSGSSFAAGNDSRFHTQNTDTGTSAASFQINSGVRIKNNAGVLEVRNSADSAFADLTCANLLTTDNKITLNSDVTTGTPTDDIGIEGLRGTAASTFLHWVEASDRWEMAVGNTAVATPIAGYRDGTFTNATLSSGILTITHNLNRKFVDVVIADNNDRKIGNPDQITYTNNNSLQVDLTTFGTITGTWNYVVS